MGSTRVNIGNRWHPLPIPFRHIAAATRGTLLLETAHQDRGNEKSFLFLDPVRELVAQTTGDLESLLKEVDAHTAAGYFVAGYFAYECGEHFLGLSPATHGVDGPLAWLGVYRQPIVFDHRMGATYGNLPASQRTNCGFSDLSVEGLQIGERDYAAKIDRIQQYLAAGDTYQVNFTDKVCGSITSEPLDIYDCLIEQQPVSFAAYVNCSHGPVLSFSPELFYRTSNGVITVRPMKGTWARGVNAEQDRNAEAALRNDEKNRSEHITIVDLLRNDVGKVCELGSVHVERLLAVERYATLFQMTSTVSGKLYPHLTPSAIFRHLFPSGSITGAPKRRTMEIIRDVESAPRGIYTGAIGYFGPAGEACFNVAIRTMSIHGKRFSMGVGGGITADSRAEEEFNECRMKAAFLTKRDRPFSLIETMHCAGGIALLEQHLKRLENSAAYFEIVYNAFALQREIETAIRDCGKEESKIRLELHLNGSWQIERSALEVAPWNGKILLASERTASGNVFLHHKTTNRSFYNQQLARAVKAGFDEVLFLNERSEMTEGAISNIFLERDGRLHTPALSCGVLPGVKRSAILLQELHALEESIDVEMLRGATAIWMCNALRGMRAVRLIQAEDGKVIWECPSGATIA